MQALLSGPRADQSAVLHQSPSQSLFSKFDANSDGQISQSEFVNAIGSGADKSNVDALFSKLDNNGDGSLISADEMQSSMQKAHGGGGHHHHHAGGAGGSNSRRKRSGLQQLLSGASADGTTSQSSTNADGSTTTTITYSDGTTMDLTTPVVADNSGSGCSSSTNPEASNLRQHAEAIDQPASAVRVTSTTNLSL